MVRFLPQELAVRYGARPTKDGFHVEVGSPVKRWSFLEKEVLHDYLNPADLYLTRYRLVQTPWFGVFVHCIHRPDKDRFLHDHPWSFTSIVLRGGYKEVCRRDTNSFTFAKTHKAGSVHRMPLKNGYHAIRTLLRVPTWTLIFTGRRVKDWGYLTSGGWVHHAVVAASEQYRMLQEAEALPFSDA